MCSIFLCIFLWLPHLTEPSLVSSLNGRTEECTGNCYVPCGVPAISPCNYDLPTHQHVNQPLESQDEDKIVTLLRNSSESVYAEWPWMVIIYYTGHLKYPIGSAVLLSETWAMSDMSIFAGESTDIFLLSFGEYNIETKDGPVTPIYREINLYSRSEFTDSCLVLLRFHAVQYSFAISPICLPDDNTEDHYWMRAMTAGWGAYSDFAYSTILREASVLLMDNSTCKEQLKQFGNEHLANLITDKHACTNADTRHCPNDYGGPVMFYEKDKKRWIVEGIFTNITNCNMDENFPGVYLRVNQHLYWIKSTIERNVYSLPEPENNDCQGCPSNYTCGIPKQNFCKYGTQHNHPNMTIAQPKISNEHDSMYAEWPWVVAIAYKSHPQLPICAATLLSNIWAISIIFCIDSDLNRYELQFGQYNVAADNEPIQVVRRDILSIIRQSEFPTPSDGAIVFLKFNHVNYTFSILNMCLPEREGGIQAGTDAFVTGWTKNTTRSSSKGRTIIHDKLQKWKIQVVGWKECQLLLNSSGKPELSKNVSSKHICSVDIETRKPTCKGDVGSPMVKYDNKQNKWIFHGILSNMFRCDDPGYKNVPAVYYNVTPMFIMIEQVVNHSVRQLSN